MKKVLTNDDSETFVNAKGESYHSISGAVNEALKKYVEPCNIAQIAKMGKLRILDFCFGLGYNSAMAIEVALQANPHCQIEVIGLENDMKILHSMSQVNPPIPAYQMFQELVRGRLEVTRGNVRIQVMLGDGREMIKHLPDGYFDAVFFDPFSPKTNPEMWTQSIFRQIFRVMGKDATLATYSCARSVRENMSKVGLFYDDGPIVGRRGPGTVATKWETLQ